MQWIKWTVIFICSINIAYAQTNPDHTKQAAIQHILDHWRAQSGIPSATLSILQPGQKHPLTLNSGTIAYNHKEKPTADTLFQAGSITKSFTSTIILQLEAKGKLNIDDPITKYLPQYPRWHNVTIRQLLNHTSGIFNYTETGTFNTIRSIQPQAEFTPDEIIRIASAHRDYFAPGHGWKYSNTNYVLAGMIIEKVMGESVEIVMNRLV